MTDLSKYNALYAALSGNAALMAKITAISDVIPDNQESPYIKVGTANETHDLIEKGSEIEVTLHIWSEYLGRKEILEIRELVKAALPSWAMYEGIDIIQDSDEPNWWHGIITIKYYE
ncbi:MAG: DUF3168 domain-containing protein [Synergistaceae bacterium]|nr:DUF3168 domain-containing protein [Synergistaceae bacterium]